MPLQISCVGVCTNSLQPVGVPPFGPPLHASVPAPQMPGSGPQQVIAASANVGLHAGELQCASTDASLKRSSIWPLQSSSARLHVSGCGVISPTHVVNVPCGVHFRVPVWQMPLLLVP